jgi:putative NADH-flavin reductase
MKIVVFGASGGTGRLLVAQGARREYTMSAVVRRQLDFGTDATSLLADVTNAKAVERAIRGHDVVISALGAHGLVSRDPAMIVGLHNILMGMATARVRRLIYLSNNSVPSVRDCLSPLGRYILAPLVLRAASADHAVNEALIMAGETDWTIVRPPRLTNAPPTGQWSSGERLRAPSLLPSLSRADLATFMLHQVDSDLYLRRAPTVVSGSQSALAEMAQ